MSETPWLHHIITIEEWINKKNNEGLAVGHYSIIKRGILFRYYKTRYLPMQKNLKMKMEISPQGLYFFLIPYEEIEDKKII